MIGDWVMAPTCQTNGARSLFAGKKKPIACMSGRVERERREESGVATSLRLVLPSRLP